MEYKKYACRICSSNHIKEDGKKILCVSCGAIFKAEEETKKFAEEMSALADEIKAERVAALRQQLYEKTTAEYIDSEAILGLCTELKNLLPNDFLANFYEVANGGTVREYIGFLNGINPSENYPLIESVIRFTVKSLSLSQDLILPLYNLIEKTYKTMDTLKYAELQTIAEGEAEKVLSGIYDVNAPRDAFIIYSGKDMDKVMELVESLENQGITCFVALRNLQHGRGAKANYEEALEKAMNACKCVIFVSSKNSRNASCDALRVELPYLKKGDIRNAPAQYRRGDYASIPMQYKKRRVEYMIEASAQTTAADRAVKEFFSGLEYCLMPDEVADRILSFDSEVIEPESSMQKEFAAFRSQFEAMMRGQSATKEDNEIEKLKKLLAEAEKRAKEAENEKRALEEEKQKRAEADRRKAEEEKKAREEAERRKIESKSTKNPPKDDVLKNSSENTAHASTFSAKDTHIGRLKIGDKLQFGSYRPLLGKKKQKIEWKILDIKDEKALLWSDLCPDEKLEYNMDLSMKNIKWRESSLRRHLQNHYATRAFNDVEQELIHPFDIPESINPRNGLSSGATKRQEIFILSKEEIDKYSLSTEQLKSNMPYWVRTPGDKEGTQMIVSESGQINEAGVRMSKLLEIGYRPAIWVDYKKLDNLVYIQQTKDKVLNDIQQQKAPLSDSAKEAFQKGEEYNETRDYKSAIDCYQRAANEGHLLAQCRLGETFLYGNGVPVDHNKAFALIEPVAKLGIAHAQLALGVYYHIARKGDENKAREFYELAAKQGDVEAQYLLANSYTHDYHNAPVDYNKGFRWYKMAAEQGHSLAQYALGFCYYEGLGTKQDYKKAVELFLKSVSRRSNVFAEWVLGICFEYGHGVEQNQAVALKWYKKAARNGHPEAKKKVQELTQNTTEET